MTRVSCQCVALSLWRENPHIRQVKQLGPKRLRMTLREGRNRQVRRMLEALGYDTVRLTRTAFMGISGADVPRGYWRDCDEVRACTTAGAVLYVIFTSNSPKINPPEPSQEEMRIIERALERAGQAGMDYSIDGVKDGRTRGGAGAGEQARSYDRKQATSDGPDLTSHPTNAMLTRDPMDFYDLSGLDLAQFGDGDDSPDIEASELDLRDFDFSDAINLDD